MTFDSSAFPRRAVRTVAAALVLLAALVALALRASAAPTTVPVTTLSASLTQSSTAVIAGGTMGFTAVIRLPAAASYMQARLQVKRPGDKVVFQRTAVLDNAIEGTHTFSFSRPLQGLGLAPGAYPVTLQVLATINGSDVETEVATQLRVYDPEAPQVPAVVIVRIRARPMTGSQGRYDVDPASEAKLRDDVDRISAIIAEDPASRITLAIPPITLEDWRRIANGYTLSSGTVVPASDPVPIAYSATLQRLKLAMGTGRLELTALGYADPNLPELTANRLSADVAPQYDTGLSAVFASIESTPSTGTVPTGGCVPAPIVPLLEKRGVGYVVVDAECAKVGKRNVTAGAYPVSGSRLKALVTDALSGRELSSGETSAALARSFAHVGGTSGNQPFPVRIDLTQTGPDATSTVGLAVSTFELAPWTRLSLGRESLVPKSARAVTFPVAPVAASHPEFWTPVRKARQNAAGLLAALGVSDPGAGSAQAQSLIAESSAWSEPDGTYLFGAPGLSFANAAIKTGGSVFGKIKVSASQVTFAGSRGDVPVNIENSSQKTLDVVVTARPSGGVAVVGSKTTRTRLAPRETFVQIPVDMQSALSGKLTVEVVSGPLVISRQTVVVRRSYLDRVALIVGIVLVLGGMLAFIVRRVATAPELDDEETAEAQGIEVNDSMPRYTVSNRHDSETEDTE